MFYVEKWHRDNKKELAIIHIGPPIIVFLAFVGITLWSWIDANQNINDNRNEVLSARLYETERNVSGQLSSYENILRAGVGLFDASNNVSRGEWSQFVRIMELPTRYPSVVGLGYVEIIQPANVASHEAAYRDAKFPKYSIYPDGDRPLYTSIVYLEPDNAANRKVVGYDMYSDKTRRAAMDLARDSGKATITSVAGLIQDKQEPDQPGLLMYVPLYKRGSAVSTVEDRRQNATGYVYAAFRSQDLLKQITDQIPLDGYGFQIYNDNENPKELLYQTANYSAVSTEKNNAQEDKPFTVENQNWIIHGAVDQSVIAKSDKNRPATLLWGGLLFSVFLAGFIYMLLINRTRALTSKEAIEIQNAKDELLALASHQLRTPATGVKQYLGLLREGYAGALNKDQRTYINKAYESNERQLTTINEMLFVARSDAGNIKLTIRHFSMSNLLRDILEEQRGQIKERRHQVTTNIADSVNMYGDEQYLRMAIENVISNSIKYTPRNGQGKISLELKKTGDRLIITIEDNGVGVNQKDITLLFRKFSRIPNELTSQVSGSGIGLYLTKSIVKAHHGNISFESVVNVGSTVVISLPAKLPKESLSL